MTGIEQLRKLGADAVRGGEVGRAICDIADQIERERDAEVADSPYDAILPEDRDALAWVREHGGIDHVRKEWRSRVPHERYEARRQCLLRHIAECETALRRRNERIAELEGRVKALTTENAELRKRAMPEGMEWPRYEDGEPVRIGEDVDTRRGICTIKSVRLYDGSFTLYGEDKHGLFEVCHISWKDGERVRRPAPKVLDADGAEIREKCDVWWICEGDERGVHAKRLRVETICPYGLIECSPYNGGTWVHLKPSELYVNKPVPASDGRPLREGEMVWGTKGGSYHLTSIHDGKVFARHVGGPFGAEVESAGGNGLYQLRSDQLTHTKPGIDTWERIEDDCTIPERDYYARHIGHDVGLKDDAEIHEAVSCDLVRRARALAGVTE